MKELIGSDGTRDMNEMELLVECAHENIIHISSIFYVNDQKDANLCFAMPIYKLGDLLNDLFIHQLIGNYK